MTRRGFFMAIESALAIIIIYTVALVIGTVQWLRNRKGK